MTKSTLKELSKEEWKIDAAVGYGDVKIIGHRGSYLEGIASLGQLATLPCPGRKHEVADLGGADGRNLYAIALLPQFAGLVEWVLAEIARMSGMAMSSFTEHGRFVQELRQRAQALADAVDERPDTLADGIHQVGKEKAK